MWNDPIIRYTARRNDPRDEPRERARRRRIRGARARRCEAPSGSSPNSRPGALPEASTREDSGTPSLARCALATRLLMHGVVRLKAVSFGERACVLIASPRSLGHKAASTRPNALRPRGDFGSAFACRSTKFSDSLTRTGRAYSSFERVTHLERVDAGRPCGFRWAVDGWVSASSPERWPKPPRS